MEDESMHPRAGTELLGRFTLEKLIAKGGFSSVWTAKDKESELRVVAKCVRDPMHTSMLEARIYRDLSDTEGFPKYYGCCTEDHCLYIMIELLHRDLFYTYRCKRHKFTEEYIYSLGLQMFERIESLHALGFVHRDLKPSQFMYKRSSHTVYLIDFNLARKYPRTFAYVSQHKGGLVGNLTYASLNAHTIGQQTRRDDCESLLYILLYLLKGNLPWQGSHEQSREIRSHVAGVKARTALADLCRGLPAEFALMISKTRSMTFEATPDYAYYKSTLDTLRRNLSLSSDSCMFGMADTSLLSVTFLTSAESPGIAPEPIRAHSTDCNFDSAELQLVKKKTKKQKRNTLTGLRKEAKLRTVGFYDDEVEEKQPSVEKAKDKCRVF
jgi:serine/threonine protein kinase